jgi:hypothetical protein
MVASGSTGTTADGGRLFDQRNARAFSRSADSGPASGNASTDDQHIRLDFLFLIKANCIRPHGRMTVIPDEFMKCSHFHQLLQNRKNATNFTNSTNQARKTWPFSLRFQ